MSNLICTLLLLTFALALNGHQATQPPPTRQSADAQDGQPSEAICEAAGAKLQESGASEVVLELIIDTKGNVQSFKTQSPSGLKLEKMRDVATAVKSMKFKPARKDGAPVVVLVKISFNCSKAAN